MKHFWIAAVLAVVIGVGAMIGYWEREKSLRREYESAKEAYILYLGTSEMVNSRQNATPAEKDKARKELTDAYFRLHSAAESAGLPGPESVKAAHLAR